MYLALIVSLQLPALRLKFKFYITIFIGASLKKIEEGKGIIVRFVIGRRFKFLLLNLLGLGFVNWNIAYRLHTLLQ